MEPPTYRWLIPGRLAVAERPGGGGRSHRIARRDAELAWWRQQGVRSVVSGMRSRHGLVEAGLAGFAIRWYPLRDDGTAATAMTGLVEEVAGLLDTDAGAILVHCDRPGEWLTATTSALLVRLELAGTGTEALEIAGREGLPVGSLAVALVHAFEEEHHRQAAVTT